MRPGQREAGPYRAGAVHEQRHRVVVPQPLDRDRAGLRDRQWRQPHQPFARDGERLAAGDQQPDVGAGPQQRGGQPGTGLHQVLAVVQQEQGRPAPEVVDEVGLEPATGLLPQPEHRRDRVRQQRGVGQPGQLDPVRLVLLGPGGCHEDVPYQPALAAAR